MLPVLTDVIPNAEKNCSSTPPTWQRLGGTFWVLLDSSSKWMWVFFFAIFFKEKITLCQNLKRNVLKLQNLSEGGGNVSKLFSHISDLSTRRPSSMQSGVAGCVFCVRVHVCVWATLCLWFTAPPTLSPLSVCWSTAMVKEATIRSAINLDTSYLCLPLQGEVCPVTNMINPLPLCWQPPAHPPAPQPPSSLP